MHIAVLRPADLWRDIPTALGHIGDDPNIIWVGTGEECPRNSIAWGDGIYKSVDGGKTFTHMGLKSTHSIARVLPHPDSPDVVYAAAAGHTWGYSGDRGLYKTTDGGTTWQKLTNGLPDDGKTGAIDLVTQADEEAQAAIVETLSQAFPSHQILAEEGKLGHGESLEGPIWVVEPLVGTTNFAHMFRSRSPHLTTFSPPQSPPFSVGG